MDELKEIEKDQYDSQKVEKFLKESRGHRHYNTQRKQMYLRNCGSREDSTHATWNVRSHHGSPDNPKTDDIIEVCEHQTSKVCSICKKKSAAGKFISRSSKKDISKQT